MKLVGEIPPPPLRSRKWSEMREEILYQIISLLPLSDISHFGSVCSSWRSAMLSHRHLFRPPPLLVLGSFKHSQTRPPNLFVLESDEGGSSSFKKLLPATKFRNPNDKKDKPPRKLKLGSSSFGYLGFSGWGSCKFDLLLYNPISRHSLTLPPIKSRIVHKANVDAPVLFTNPLLSSSHHNCLVVTSCVSDIPYKGLARTIFSYNGGMNRWVNQGSIFISERHHLFTMEYYKGGIYVVLGPGENLGFYSQEEENRVAMVVFQLEWDGSVEFGMVESGGDLLLVFMYGGVGDQERWFEVFKLADEEWERIASLGDDRVLLISKYGANSFSNKEVVASGFRSNCIYELCTSCRDMFVYSMEDGSCERVFIPDEGLDGIWLMPQGW